MYKKKKHKKYKKYKLPSKGIIEKANKMKAIKPSLPIMTLIENFLYGLCGVTANTSPLQGDV